MYQTMVNFRMDTDDKVALEALCEKLGLTLSTAFKIFAKKCFVSNESPSTFP